MRAATIFIFLFFQAFAGYSQKTDVTGLIVDSLTHKKLSNVTVSVFQKGQDVHKFLSDSTGHFKIPFTLFISSSRIEIQALSYNVISFTKDTFINTENFSSYIGEFKLVPSGINLADVIIKTRRKRYRDTTNIDLSDQKFEREIMIDDLFSKNLGFYKDNTGKLFYKGKPVADLLVNGGDFFGKNNTDIYKNLPALILNNIEIIETDIDSLTNTTLLNPTVKVNLKFKDQYKKGKFGNANFGIGTLNRYIGTVDLYTYKKEEQISLNLNSNNLNVGDSFSEPRISFSGSGNNTLNHSSRITYRNLFYKKKIELAVYIKPKINQIKFQSESDRKDQEFNQFSSTFNSSKTKTFSFNGTNINLTYKIDSLNVLRFIQTLDYENNRKIDSLNYFINANNSLDISNLNKIANPVTKTFSSNLSYQKLFSKKKGRLFGSTLIFDLNKYRFNEENKVVNFSDNLGRKYFVDGERIGSKKQFTINNYLTEPFSENGYVSILLDYKFESIQSREQIQSDSLANTENRNLLDYQYFSPGIKFFNRYNNFTLESVVNGMLNIRDVGDDKKEVLWNFNAKLALEYKITKTRNLLIRYDRTTTYPDFIQLTGINNSFDVISFSKGNLKLKPELKDRLEFTYDLRKTDSVNVFLSGNIEQYRSKFGFTINALPGETQINFIDNVGKAVNADISLAISKNLNNGRNFSYRLSGTYQELPTNLNRIIQVSKNYGISQSISSNLKIIESILSISPSLSSTFSKYIYQNSRGNQINIIYTDKISLNYLKFEFNTYPFVNFNYSINRNFSFAMNAEIRKNILKKYVTVWLKAYDVFNSFNYVNNINSASYIQNVRYSNISRYFLLGANIKFNNMK
ncbi:outer membrane beta-barrel protein [Pedobacter psychrotolerans]|uniref:outer membrane beta-barrel protein n=1 Tax=Pedobacter psychrotolerans TaxID=1843235 RepID=UPI003F9C44DD